MCKKLSLTLLFILTLASVMAVAAPAAAANGIIQPLTDFGLRTVGYQLQAMLPDSPALRGVLADAKKKARQILRSWLWQTSNWCWKVGLWSRCLRNFGKPWKPQYVLIPSIGRNGPRYYRY